MKLTEKEFIKADGTVIKLTPEWISSKLTFYANERR